MAEAAVVVPFRGDPAVLPTLLHALHQQTVRADLEIILSVDGTDTPSREICSLADRVVTGPSRGPASARNRGWRETSARFVLFTDSDCIPDPHWAEKMLSPLRGEFQAVKGIYSEGGSRVIQRLAQIEFRERYRIMAKRDSVLLADTYSAGFRRSWLEKLEGFDESFPLPDHEDVDLSWRLTAAGGRIAFVPDASVRHTHRPSWLSYFRMKVSRGRWRMILVKRFPDKVVSDGYTPQMLKLQMLIAPAVVAGLALLPAVPVVSGIVFALFLGSCIPILGVSLSTDRAVAPLIPFFCLWRALALDFGSLRGLAGGR